MAGNQDRIFLSAHLPHRKQKIFICAGTPWGKVSIESFPGKIIKTWFHCPQKKPPEVNPGVQQPATVSS
jgi:hypothetical protein